MATITVGSSVWLENSEQAWTDGEVVGIDGDKVSISVETVQPNRGPGRRGKAHKTVVVPLANCHPKDLDVPNGGVDDMTKLAYLHEPGVLDNLRCRYALDEIYTYTGSILIAVNPFANLPHLYDVSMMEQYRGARLGELSPHVFAIAESAYRAMTDENRSQSILVSGESGAGKTETTKLIMQYLAYMGGRADTEGRTVESQVLESNPLLEAFGNAKTVRNENSSRFGKFVEIQFDGQGRISGAAVRTYLLERSRVVQISDPERNYHCFYQLCAGATPEERVKYKLGPPEEYRYLNQSNCYELEGKDSNAHGYLRTKRAMDVVGVTEEEQDFVFSTLAAILHLGNIEFVPGTAVDSSSLKDKQSIFHLNAAAELLSCKPEDLEVAMTTRTIVTRDESILKHLVPEASVVSRDTLAKTIYSRLFDWLVEKINVSIGQDPTSKTLIGVLDIYGFESFQSNSFEQFCINLANEKLQQHFNQHVFKMEQDEYEREEIDWSYIEFVDNQDVLDLIEKKPMGIISLLDEQCMFPRSTHETFATKLYQTLSKHKRFSKPKMSQTDFTIDHYAGQVTYQTNLFLDKNKDYVVAEHQALLGNSGNPYVAGLFRPPSGEEAKTKFSSLGGRFKQQLSALMDTLNLTEPHYIRCVKPNMVNKPSRFEPVFVLQQLRSGGVLEAIRISCAGYPTRRIFDDFLDRFGLLAPELLDGSMEEKAAVDALLKRKGLSNYQVGKTMVFLRAGQMVDLDTMRIETLNRAAKAIQRRTRTFLARKEFVRLRRGALAAQKLWRGKLARQRYRELRRHVAAVRIQKQLRRFAARTKYLRTKRAALVLQAGLRGMAGRKQAMHSRQSKAAVRLQAHWRGYQAKSALRRQKWAAVVLQAAWRARAARKELRRLKLEARQSGALQAAKTKLEKQCEELTWRLQLEKRMRADIEESKAQEILKLQSLLEIVRADMDAARADLALEQTARKTFEDQLAEARAELEAERAALKNAAVHPWPESPQVKASAHPIAAEGAAASAALRASGGDAVSPHLAEKLSVENERLKALLDESDSRAADAESQLSEYAERRAELEGTEQKLAQLQDTLSRVEEQAKQLEQENQLLRQQTLSPTPPKGAPFSRQIALPPTYLHANNHAHHHQHHRPYAHENGILTSPSSDQRLLGDSPSDGIHLHSELELKRQKLLFDRQQSEQETVLQCLASTGAGFSGKRPVAACVVYKCLLHWRSFEAERTTVFDRIIQTIGASVEAQAASADVLGYWLSNTATLLFLLQQTLRASGSAAGAGGSATKRRATSASLFGRMTQSFRGSPSLPNGGLVANGGAANGVDSVRQVDAKYPALLFKQQLTAYVEKIYGMIRDNLKKDISPMLGSCIQAPRTSRSSMTRGSAGKSPATHAQQALSSHWGSIITSLSGLLNTMRANHVPPFLVRKLFTQIFSFINVQLFNSLLLRRECCSFSNGEYVKAGLAELEHWVYEAQEEYAGSSWDELKYIRQAVGFLVIHQKPKKSLHEITHDLCPVLSIQQLYRISTMYWDDKYGTHSVSPDVISAMRVLMTEDSSNSAVSNSFLLDDDSSIPFSVDDISKSMQSVDLSDVEPPETLRGTDSLSFLLTQHD